METSLSLKPCRLSPEQLHEPLPYDLYSANGTLLLRHGSCLNGNGKSLLGQSLYRARLDTEGDDEMALSRLVNIFLAYEQLTALWAGSAEELQRLRALARALTELCAEHSDVCTCMAAYLPGTNYAIRHSFAVAIVANVLGNSLGWEADDLHTVVSAALTMNLSRLSHHHDWARTRGRLSAVDKATVHRHPVLSAELLSQAPGADQSWIDAVDQHHENVDGSGYPFGLRGERIAPEARVLRVADTWCALVLHHSGRSRKPPSHALHELASSARGQLDFPMFLALKKLMGAYPPGTAIRLANRETALVVRWNPNGSAPRSVLSVFSPAGEIMPEFKIRNVNKYGFGIRDYTELNYAQTLRLPWSHVLASS